METGRAAAHRATRTLHPGRADPRRHRRRARRAGLDRRRHDRRRRPRRPGHGPAGQRADRGRRRPPGRSSPPPPPTSPTYWSTAGWSSGTAGTSGSTCRPTLPAGRSGRCGGERPPDRACWSTTSANWSPTSPAARAARSASGAGRRCWSRTAGSPGSARRQYAPAADGRIDADGAAVLPGFVDSHSHLVFAGDRAAEFAARMAGQPYTGGGIRTTVGATRAASDDTLRANVARLRIEALRQGTTTIEIKSGYGLSVADEARSLRIAAEFTTETTFLGAHVVPAEYADRPDDYVGLVCGPMLRAAAAVRPLDRRLLRAGRVRRRPRPRHPHRRPGRRSRRTAARQPARARPRRATRGGTRRGQRGPLHPPDRRRHRRAGRIGRRWPPCCRGPSSPPGRRTRTPARLLDAGAVVALATDCNPGSSYTSSMPFCVALAVREMRHDPGGGGLGRDRRRGAGAAPRRHRRAAPRRAGRPDRSSTRRRICTWPTGQGYH